MYNIFLNEIATKSKRAWNKLKLGESDFVALLRSRRIIEGDIKNGRSCQRTVIKTLGIDESLITDSVHKLIEDITCWIVAVDGYVPLRQVPVKLGSFKKERCQTVYFRPSVFPFLTSLQGAHPLLMASTLEPQRMIEATVEHFTATQSHRVFSWRITSGLRELSLCDGSLIHEPWALSATAMQNAIWDEEPFPQPSGDLLQSISVGEDNEEGGFSIPGAVHDALRNNFLQHLLENDFHRLQTEGNPQIFFKISYGVSLNSNDSRNENSVDSVTIPGLHIKVYYDDNDIYESYDRDAQFFREAVSAVLRAKHLELASQTAGFDGFVNSLRLCIEHCGQPSIFLFNDIHIFLSSGPGSDATKATAVAAISDAFHDITRKRIPAKVVLLGSEVSTPAELREEINSIDVPLPTLNELFYETKKCLLSVDHVNEYSQDEEFISSIAEAARGLTLAETKAVILDALDKSLIPQLHKEDLIEAVRETKRTMVNRSPVLELYEADRLPSFNPGAIEQFEGWLKVRRRVFEEPEKARHFGIVERPKGVLLLGVPGSGKSLSAKIIARDWNLPLVRLDVGAIRDKFVGSSEARIRDALKTVEAMSPCVLWIDEIDKGMSDDDSVGSHSTDLNIRATLLTWMQENQAPIFLVATANKFKSLPPELTRAGRFDARFFFGCPGPSGRKTILDEHLKKHDIDTSILFAERDSQEIVRATHGFTGAEIEQVVLDALYVSFDADRDLKVDDLEGRALETQPIIKFFGDELEQIWELIEQGRVELVSSEMLKRSQVAQLIDPDLFRPMYCRKELIEGFEKHASRADRLLMASPFAGSRLIVLDTGDASWVYIQANFKFSNEDDHNYKLLEEVSKLGPNLVLETLIGEYGVECVLFAEKDVYDVFVNDDALGLYSEFYELMDSETE